MLTNNNEKITLEAIDQLFEQDSSFNYIENYYFYKSDLEIEKMSDKFAIHQKKTIAILLVIISLKIFQKN